MFGISVKIQTMASGPQPQEQLVFFAVILGGIAALIFGIAYAKDHITDPLAFEPVHIKTIEEQDQAKLEELRTKDTDADKLSDYDELYVWKTSPYIQDSDSDGYDDKTEIESGNDPNCPQGTECRGASSVASDNSDSATLPKSDPLRLLAEPARNQLFGSKPMNFLDPLSGSSPEELRTMLRQLGVPDEQLKQIDDATLLQLYQESLGQVQAQAAAGANPTPVSQP